MTSVTAAPPGPVLSLLGGFDLSLDAEPVPVCASAQRLLAYLAVHRARPVRRGPLSERLWSDADPRRAASSLRSALWRLPRPAGRELVVTSPTTVTLAPDVRVDLWTSEDAARGLLHGRPEESSDEGLVGALTRDLLPDWCEDWLLLEQESYRQTRLHALEALSASLRVAGQFAAALAAGLAALRSEPLRESAHRRVVEVHLAEGNPAEALRQYDAYRRLLGRELGLPPSPAIRRLVAPLLGRPIDGRDEPGPTPVQAPVPVQSRVPVESPVPVQSPVPVRVAVPASARPVPLVRPGTAE